MNSLIGFTVIYKAAPTSVKKASLAQQRALAPFAHLAQKKITLGESWLTVWGHNDIDAALHYLPDGSLLALIGASVGDFSWADVEAALLKISDPAEFTIPWDGRVILLKISPDGREWTMWNDWMGSIPVFHAPAGKGCVAGTLEPVVVAAAGLTPDEISLPALLSLFIHGHYLGEWTLFERMKVVPPDCAAVWRGQDFYVAQNVTVQPSDERWQRGWDELVEEMYELSRRAIADVLKKRTGWLLPLSGGLDSRLIAAVSAEMGMTLPTYTFGAANSRDVLYARQVARTLGLPWQQISLSNDYLARYARPWANLFGSAMHFHGMHQMLFLDTLAQERPGPILSGFLGDALSGYGSRFVYELHSSGAKPQIVPEGYTHWSVPEVEKLMKMPVGGALEELSCEITRAIEKVPAPRYQQIRYLVLWSRQRFFTYFNSMLSDYWRGVATPFINKAYARFCYSLPRAVMDDRRLLADVFQRYYPQMAAIPSTYWRPGMPVGEPIKPTGSYFLQRRIAQKLPGLSRFGRLRLFNPGADPVEAACVKAHGWDSFWPVREVWDQLAEWLDMEQVGAVYEMALAGAGSKPVRKLQSVQTLAYCLWQQT